MAPPSLFTIPPEIFELVLNEISDKQSLWSLSRVNKTFFKRVLPRLYRDVHLRRRRTITWPVTADFKDNIRSGLKVLNRDTFSETLTGQIVQDQFPDGLGGGIEGLKIEDVAVGGSGICEILCCAQYLSEEHISRAAEAFAKVDQIGGFEKPGAFQKARRSQEDHDAYIEKFNALIRDIIASLPHLKRLSLGGVVEWQNKTLESVKHIGVTHFELKFHERMHRYRSSGYHYNTDDELDMKWKRATGEKYTFNDDLSHISVSGFRNLTSFKVFNLYGDLSRYVSDIAEVLVENRHSLKEIGFSLSDHKLESLEGGAFGLVSYKYDEFDEWEERADPYWIRLWDKICSRYIRKVKKLPGATDDSFDKLHLESLILGNGFYMLDEPLSPYEKTDIIQTAIELKFLRKVDWANKAGSNCEALPINPQLLGWGTLALCDKLEDIKCDEVCGPTVDLFFEERSSDATPIKRFVAAYMDDEGDEGVPQYLPYVLTEHVLHVELPGLKLKKMKKFHDCKSLEYVKVEIEEDEDEDDEDNDEEEENEEEITDEDKKNPLCYLTHCENLRTIIICGTFEDLDWKSYVDSKIDERIWPRLEEITVTKERYNADNLITSKIRNDGNGRKLIGNE